MDSAGYIYIFMNIFSKIDAMNLRQRVRGKGAWEGEREEMI